MDYDADQGTTVVYSTEKERLQEATQGREEATGCQVLPIGDRARLDCALYEEQAQEDRLRPMLVV